MTGHCIPIDKPSGQWLRCKTALNANCKTLNDMLSITNGVECHPSISYCVHRVYRNMFQASGQSSYNNGMTLTWRPYICK